MASDLPLVARRATPAERARIDEFLAQASLPPLPSNISLSNVLVATRGGTIVGTIALEVLTRLGLLRSFVVDPAHRESGVGKRLMQAVLSRVNELGLRAVYLLTESEPAYFEPHGFVAVERERVPKEIQKTPEFREQCSEDAVVMVADLELRI